MFSTEQRKIAIETFIGFDHSYADTIAELGYPARHSLRAWCKDCLEHGEVRPPKRQREPKLTLEMRQAAVDYYLAHGKSEPCQYNGQRNRRFLHGQHVFRTVPEGPPEAVEELLHRLCRHAVPDGPVRTDAVVV